MGLKAVVEKLDDVDEAHREFYVERGGKFELSVEISGVEGVRSFSDFSKLNESLRKERNDHKATKEKFTPFSDLDINEVRAKLDRFPELEAAAAGKMDDAAIAKIVEGRLNSVTAPLKRDLENATKALGERDTVIDSYTKRDRQRSISDAVRSAASKLKVQDSAIEDAILLAERTFDVDEHGTITTKDGVGVIPGVSPEVWLTDMQSKRPHWWGPSQGGGAGGSSNGGNAAANPWSADGWNMTQQGAILKENRSRAEQLARAAGTSIGGQRPAKK